MLENDRINWCDWTIDSGALEYDLSYLHPKLGVLLQEYQINSTTYEGKRIYQSDFYLFEPDSSVPGNFHHLALAVKAQIWEIVFAVKHKFFVEISPEIVEHFIGQEHSLEKRYDLYRNRLNLPDYTIDSNIIRRTITYQKQRTPANNGGGSLLLER